MKNIHEQLRSAMSRRGLSLAQLLTLSRLDLDASSLSRKLAGKQTLRVEEAVALARALGIRIAAGREARV